MKKFLIGWLTISLITMTALSGCNIKGETTSVSLFENVTKKEDSVHRIAIGTAVVMVQKGDEVAQLAGLEKTLERIEKNGIYKEVLVIKDAIDLPVEKIEASIKKFKGISVKLMSWMDFNQLKPEEIKNLKEYLVFWSNAELASNNAELKAINKNTLKRIFTRGELGSGAKFNGEKALIAGLMKINSPEFRKTQKVLPMIYEDGKYIVQEFEEGGAYDDQTVSVSFLGDIMVGRFVKSLADKNGEDFMFREFDKIFWVTGDFLIGNLEGPIAEKAIATSKAIAFRFEPKVGALLKKYGFSYLSLANNHALDMGANGYTDSIRILNENGIGPFGNPKLIDENSVALINKNGIKIALLGLDDVDFKVDDEAAMEKVRDLRAQGFLVIPFLHWGVEYSHKPSYRQQELGRKLIDAGSYMVIGAHPHVIEGMEYYKGKAIFYSLGNAVFDQYFSAETQEGLAINLEIEKNNITERMDGGEPSTEYKTKVYLMPFKIEKSVMKMKNQEERKDLLNRFFSWSDFGDFDSRFEAQVKNGILEL